MTDADAVPACLACGACCFSTLETFVRVTGDDLERLGSNAALARFDGHRAYMRMKEGHCAALVVDAATERFVCSVYLLRPDVCRDLERTSAACVAERVLKAERPLSALGRSRARLVEA